MAARACTSGFNPPPFTPHILHPSPLTLHLTPKFLNMPPHVSLLQQERVTTFAKTDGFDVYIDAARFLPVPHACLGVQV